tara:strand:- start:3270 stop:3677 length:408 start_codon:yes stop_codon:yes gene_type:complete
MVNMKIEGGKHLVKQLKKLDADLEKSIGDKAVAAGGRVYAKNVRKGIPVSGDGDAVVLKKSIAVKKAKRSKARGIIQYAVGVVGGARRYAHVFEFGSKYVTGTRHFTRTLDTSKQEILDTMLKKLRDELKKWGLS